MSERVGTPIYDVRSEVTVHKNNPIFRGWSRKQWRAAIRLIPADPWMTNDFSVYAETEAEAAAKGLAEAEVLVAGRIASLPRRVD